MLDEEDFEKIYESMPRYEDWTGRLVTNSLGAKETVVMPANHWKYLDWLVEKKLVDYDWAIEQADIKRQKPRCWASLATAIMMALANDERKRKKAGVEFPGLSVVRVFGSNGVLN